MLGCYSLRVVSLNNDVNWGNHNSLMIIHTSNLSRLYEESRQAAGGLPVICICIECMDDSPFHLVSPPPSSSYLCSATHSHHCDTSVKPKICFRALSSAYRIGQVSPQLSIAISSKLVVPLQHNLFTLAFPHLMVKPRGPQASAVAWQNGSGWSMVSTGLEWTCDGEGWYGAAYQHL